MILHVLADAGQRVLRLDPDLREMLGIADPGKLQQVRRADRASRHDDFALRQHALDSRSPGAAAREIDTDRALAVEYDAVHQRVRDELQIGPLQRRAQIASRGAGTPPAAAGLLAPADAWPGAGRQVVDVVAV